MAIHRKILLVDDNPLDIELTLSALKKANLANEIDTAGDGEQALDYIYCRGSYASRPDEDPSVILLDIKMPKIDGLEVLRQLKSDPQKKHIPVVMLTSSREEGDITMSYERGVNAYAVKPVGRTEFLDAIRELGLFWGVINETPKKL